MSKKNKLDQYYTNPNVAKMCYKLAIPHFLGERLAEPCAGTGAFFSLMYEDLRLGMDLDPKVTGKGMLPEPQDFLKYKGSLTGYDVVSNPPFGFGCALAVKFFNHCAVLGAETISFIIPKTFRKASVINKLHKNFFMVKDVTLEKDSFILDGKPYDVPCCFQVWVRKPAVRENINTSSDNPWFKFCTPDEADFAIRRAGGRAGELLEGLDHKEVSTYFVKALINTVRLREMLANMDLTYERANTAGVSSIAKYEIVNKLNEMETCACPLSVND